MKGHALPGPNQKASVGKNLQDYQMRDGKLVPIATQEFDDLMDKRGGYSTVDDVATTGASFNEGELVSDKATGVHRGRSVDNKYKDDEYGVNFAPNELMPEPDFRGDYDAIDRYDARRAEENKVLNEDKYRMEPNEKFGGRLAVSKDAEEQKKVNEAYAKRMKEGGKSVAQKKMKFGRKKK